MAASQVTVEFSCPVETLWHTVTDLEHTAWRSDIERVEILDAAHFVEHTRSGYATRFTVTACEALRLWAFTMENGNMSGAWEGIFTAEEGGTRLTCTETIAAKHWWMRPFVPSYLRRQQRRYLADLERAVCGLGDRKKGEEA